MKRIITTALCAFVASISVPAQAADWWWVAGDPQDAGITFVDTDSVAREGDRLSILVSSVDRSGRRTDVRRRIDCDARTTGDAVHSFACASDAERMKTGALLGAMSPVAAANALFRSDVRNAATPAPRRARASSRAGGVARG